MAMMKLLRQWWKARRTPWHHGGPFLPGDSVRWKEGNWWHPTKGGRWHHGILVERNYGGTYRMLVKEYAAVLPSSVYRDEGDNEPW